MGFAQTHKGLLERSPLTARTLTKGIFASFLRWFGFCVAVFRATNSGCYEPHSASGMSTTVVSLRYRIEMAGKLHLNGAERHAGRSLRLRPRKVRNPSITVRCRERPMCRSVSVVGYIATIGLYSTERFTLCAISNRMPVALCSHFPHKCVESS